MKTLDEVIRAMEQCTGAYIDCDDCLYTQVNAEGVSICAHDDLDKDALHYLKQYRDLQYGYIKAMADLEDNPPLDWDELKQMEGKPVWVGSKRFGNHWYLNRGINDESCMYFVGHYGENVLLYRDDFGTTWQAYRKERE